MPLKQIFIYLAVFSIVSAVTERLLRPHKKKHPKFSWHHYFFFVSVPLASMAFLIYNYNHRLIVVFLSSMIIGAILEWVLGYYYQHIVGQKLWTYKRLAISGYTSWLALPLWGCAGVLFAFISKLIIG